MKEKTKLSAATNNKDEMVLISAFSAAGSPCDWRVHRILLGRSDGNGGFVDISLGAAQRNSTTSLFLDVWYIRVKFLKSCKLLYSL